MRNPEKITDAKDHRIPITMLTCMVFFGAALLFSIEPLAGRLLTPYFGGAAHVWLVCLMFFQAMLLLGYLYAHLFAGRLGAWHLAFLLTPLVNLPLRIDANPNSGAPLLAILATLILHVGLPFIALSTTAVVAQKWLANSSAGKNREPYPLYAASNAGSLLALIGYAFLIEPMAGLRVQSFIWSGAYVMYVLLVFGAWLKIRPAKQYSSTLKKTIKETTPQPLRPIVYLHWLLFSAVPSAFLLATTNYITLEIGSFPFVWVIPLALYLGSFVVTFRTGGGVPRILKVFWPELLLATLLLYLIGPSHRLVFVGLSGVFFGICLVAHGTLYELRPHATHLTNFYLTTAFGGWIGRAFVSLVAPFLFSGLFEFPISLILFAALFCCRREKAFLNFWPKASRFAAFGRMLLLGILVFGSVLGIKASASEPTKFRHRNFYGTYRIIDKSMGNGFATVRQLVHGRTLHGSQFLDPAMRLTPLSYYYAGGPISQGYNLIPSPRRVAVVGLGSGTISAYAHKNDLLTYYEIDPDNEKIARQWFTYLDDCKGRMRMTVGDGRLSMQDWNKDTMRYDIIHIDAFTGDGIPTHLLTREAINTYLKRLRENGVILFHISNRFYDLRPVLKSTAGSLGLYGAMNVPVKDKSEAIEIRITGQCVVLAVKPNSLQHLLDSGWIAFGKGDGLSDVEPWSDDYINILASLKSGTQFR